MKKTKIDYIAEEYGSVNKLLHAIRLDLSNGVPVRKIASKYDISVSTFYDWKYKYNLGGINE